MIEVGDKASSHGLLHLFHGTAVFQCVNWLRFCGALKQYETARRFSGLLCVLFFNDPSSFSEHVVDRLQYALAAVTIANINDLRIDVPDLEVVFTF